PDFPSLVVADTEIEQPGLAVADRFERLFDNGALDATARHRADHRAGIVDRELGADRTRRGTPRRDDGGQRHARPRLTPTRCLFQNFCRIAHAALSWFARHGVAAVPRRVVAALSTSINVSRLS